MSRWKCQEGLGVNQKRNKRRRFKHVVLRTIILAIYRNPNNNERSKERFNWGESKPIIIGGYTESTIVTLYLRTCAHNIVLLSAKKLGLAYDERF
mmetsp:Transcript_5749/g.10393  ORF Transcript_5749/g.10393 Transcript_5749/m.10393 type:complete len:95 (-) Transcript_5749:490-774(-)